MLKVLNKQTNKRTKFPFEESDVSVTKTWYFLNFPKTTERKVLYMYIVEKFSIDNGQLAGRMFKCLSSDTSSCLMG